MARTGEVAAGAGKRLHCQEYIVDWPVLRASMARYLLYGMLLGSCLVVFGNPGMAFGAAPETSADSSFSFHISAGLLPQALGAFSAVTGIEVVADARNTEGCQSPGVIGVMTAREALSALTAGTRLVADEFDPGTVTLAQAATSSGTGPCGADAAAGATPAVGSSRYFGLVQRAMLRALCRNSETMPGDYHLALKLWIDAAGIISRAKRLATTGSFDRNRAIDATLQHLDIGAPPPIGLPQTIAVIIEPRVSRDATDCPMAAGAR